MGKAVILNIVIVFICYVVTFKTDYETKDFEETVPLIVLIVACVLIWVVWTSFTIGGE